MTNARASWRPDEAVVVLASNRSCGPSACHRCPYITFHSSPATAAAHLQATDIAGEILTQPQALPLARSCSAIFYDLSSSRSPAPQSPTTDHHQVAS